MYITIAGELGSGKSTVAKLINQEYKFKMYSTGALQREIAKEKGITTLELNLQMANDINNNYDKLIDNKTVEIANLNMGKDVIFDSRMAWHFVKRSFKVYVVVDSYTAADRVIKANRGIEEQYNSVEDAAAGLLKRKQVEDSRFLEMYHVDTTNFKNYDLVVDSSDISPEQLAEFIMDKARNDNGVKKIFISPKRLFPSQSIRNINPTYVKSLQYKDIFSSNIDVVFNKGFYYIIDGHHRACAKIQNGDSLIGVNILKMDSNNIIEKYDRSFGDLTIVNQSDYYDWEDYNSMRFNSYPE